jgi:PAS domain-containing protein
METNSNSLPLLTDNVKWEAIISAIRDQAGEIIKYLAVKEDITDRKKTEEVLLNERALFRTIIDLIPDAFYVKDIHGRKIVANPTEIKLAGMTSEEEIFGKTDFDFTRQRKHL